MKKCAVLRLAVGTRFVGKLAGATLALAALLVGWLCGSPTASADDTLTVVSTSASISELGVPVTLQGSHDLEIHGLSVAATFAPGVLTVSGVSYSGTAVEEAAGGDPEFSEMVVDNGAGTVILGVIFDLDPTRPAAIPPLPTPPGNDLLRLLFDVSATAVAGDYPIDLIDGLGSPPVSNLFTSAGQTIVPVLTSGMITVGNPFLLAVRNVDVSPGSIAEVIIESTHCLTMAGFTVSLTYENTALTYVPLFVGDPSCGNPVDYSAHFDCLDIAAALGDEEVEVMLITEESDVVAGRDFLSLGVVFDFCAPFLGQTFPPESDQSILRLRFATVDDPLLVGTSTLIDLVDEFPIGNPLPNLVVTVSAAGVVPELEDGLVNFVDGDLFIRGDTNSDGSLGLPDAIFLLNFLFVPGSEGPGCDDAADINDDGIIGLSDAIYFLTFQFVGGCAPPAPHPACGIDGDASDALGCAVNPAC